MPLGPGVESETASEWWKIVLMRALLIARGGGMIVGKKDR